MTDRYGIDLARAARRALEQELPEAVAAAVIEFILGPLRENPYRVGKPLRQPFAPLYVARRGDYRVIYEIHERRLLIIVVSITHRRDTYRR